MVMADSLSAGWREVYEWCGVEADQEQDHWDD
jgi:hypothetical protein